MEQEYLIGVNNKFAAFLEEGDDPFEIIKNVEAEKAKKRTVKVSLSVKVSLGQENKENKSKDANEVKAKPVKKPAPPKATERALPPVGAKTENVTERANNRRNKEDNADFPRTGNFREGKNDSGAPRGPRNDNRDRDGLKGDREERRDGNRERRDRDGDRRDNPRPFRADGDRDRGERRGPRPDGESRPYRPREGQEDGEGRPPRRDRRDFGGDVSDAEGRGERRPGGGGPRGGGRGGPRPPGRNFDNRGKREFDRRSGSDRTGVKPVDKRDGAGSYNWDTTKEPEAFMPDLNDTAVSEEVDWDAPAKDEGTPAPKDIEIAEINEENATPAEEEPLELTLDEYRKLRGSRNRPQFDIRKPGEGEDLSKWKNMVEIKKKDSEEEEYEFEISDVPQRAGRQKHVVGIDITFNDSFRGGRGRGGRGGGGGGVGGRPRESREREPREPREGRDRDGPRRFPPRDRDDRGDRGERPERRDDRRDDRPERRDDRPDRRDDRSDRNRPLAPKVDDEKAFPSLG